MKKTKVTMPTDRVVPVFGKINHETMTKTIDSVMGHWKKDSKKEITLIVCSGGGMCDPAFMFIDIVRIHGINLTTIASGGVGSMAVLIFAAGTRRLVTKHTDFFLHDLGFTPDKEERLSTTELKLKSKNLSVGQGWYARFIEERTGGKFKASRVVKLMNSESYLYSDEAVKLGLAHDVI